MSKIMICSFGTLAAIAVANFKLLPKPAAEATFLLPFDALEDAIAARDRILKGVIAPAALDLLNPVAAGQLGYKGHLLALQAGGNTAVIERCRREFSSRETVILEGADET